MSFQPPNLYQSQEASHLHSKELCAQVKKIMAEKILQSQWRNNINIQTTTLTQQINSEVL